VSERKKERKKSVCVSERVCAQSTSDRPSSERWPETHTNVLPLFEAAGSVPKSCCNVLVANHPATQ
jgi:hypothetical protein